MLLRRNVTIRKCTIRNVTIRKCTIRNVTDPQMSYHKKMIVFTFIGYAKTKKHQGRQAKKLGCTEYRRPKTLKI